MDQDTMARTPHEYVLAAPQYTGCAVCGLHSDASVHTAHEHTWYQDGTTDSEGRVIGTRSVCDCGASMDAYQEQRTRELRPLADALTIHVRGITGVRIEQTGGNVYCATGTLGTWRMDASEDGWSLTDDNGASVAWGGWYPEDAEQHPLFIDPDTGALDPDECEAAAVAFASAYFGMIGIDR